MKYRFAVYGTDTTTKPYQLVADDIKDMHLALATEFRGMRYRAIVWYAKGKSESHGD